MRRRRIAIVSTRYAPDIYGGAERYAFELARRLGSRHDVELLCTTAHDYLTWENVYTASDVTIEGVRVRRFRVDVPRSMERFDRLSERLMRARRIPLALQERWMGEQGPLSLGLLRHLAAYRLNYDAVIFVGYLYATTYFGLQLVADRAVLVPLTHDEWAIRLSMWDRIFALPRALVYNTEEERAFTQRRFPKIDVDGPVLGFGIDGPPGSTHRSRSTSGASMPRRACASCCARSRSRAARQRANSC
jgi:glycosyltransferase involved in cell wall biosynthesis